MRMVHRFLELKQVCMLNKSMLRKKNNMMIVVINLKPCLRHHQFLPHLIRLALVLECLGWKIDYIILKVWCNICEGMCAIYATLKQTFLITYQRLKKHGEYVLFIHHHRSLTLIMHCFLYLYAFIFKHVMAILVFLAIMNVCFHSFL